MKKTYKMAPAEVGEVTLTMTFREARALWIVLGEIGGTGPLREVTEAAYDELLTLPGMPPREINFSVFRESMATYGVQSFPVLRSDFEL